MDLSNLSEWRSPECLAVQLGPCLPHDLVGLETLWHRYLEGPVDQCSQLGRATPVGRLSLWDRLDPRCLTEALCFQWGPRSQVDRRCQLGRCCQLDRRLPLDRYCQLGRCFQFDLCFQSFPLGQSPPSDQPWCCQALWAPLDRARLVTVRPPSRL